MIPFYKAKDKDSNMWVEGFYYAYPTKTYCFAEDYEKGVEIVHCICFHRMTDWGLPNRPMFCDIDISTLKQIGWFDETRLVDYAERWFEPMEGEPNE